MHGIVHLIPLVGKYMRYLYKRYYLKEQITFKELGPFKNIDYALGGGLLFMLLGLAARFYHDYIRQV
jgi:hypothetical protein